MAHGLEHIVDAAEMLQHRNDIRFVFAGGGAARAQLERYVRKKQLNNVVLIPRQPKEVMPRLWSLCDLSLVNLLNAPLFTKVIPSKIFESMGMGIPMVVSVPRGEATEIVDESGSGVIIDPGSPSQLAAAVEQLRDDPKACRKLSKQATAAAYHFSREKMALKMVESFNKACQ